MQEFSDTLKYIASIRLKSEEYGICRIVPPPSWKPPCLVKEKDIWKSSKFVTQIQQIDGLQNQYFSSKAAKIYDNVNSKSRRSLNTGLQNGVGGNGCTMNPDEARCTEGFESERGPEFTLETFKKYADDFKEQYFCTKNIDMTVDENPLVFKKQGEPSLENIEGEYRRIIENPTEEIEVCSNGCDELEFLYVKLSTLFYRCFMVKIWILGLLAVDFQLYLILAKLLTIKNI